MIEEKPVDLDVLEAYALSGTDEAFGRAIVKVCAELRASRKVVEAARKGWSSCGDPTCSMCSALAELSSINVKGSSE